MSKIIKDVSLDFVPGEILVLLGPNGSGKTTLLKAALGLIPFSDGEVLYDGSDIRQLKHKQIAQKAALLSQSRKIPMIQAFRMVLHGRFPYLSYPRHYGELDKQIAHAAMVETGSEKYAGAQSARSGIYENPGHAGRTGGIRAGTGAH